MKVVLISDTHLKTDLSNLEPADLLIHAGDFSMSGTIQETIKFNQHLTAIRDRYKYGIYLCGGNHDFIMEQQRGLAVGLLTACTYLCDEEAVIDGVKFYFTPYVPNLPRWAFHKNSEGLTRAFASIPDDTNFLVTHGPPHKILDEVPVRGWNQFGGDVEGDPVGSVELFDRVMQLKDLKYQTFGHIHESYGEKFFNGVHFINASICDEYYKAVNKPIVVEL